MLSDSSRLLADVDPGVGHFDVKDLESDLQYTFEVFARSTTGINGAKAVSPSIIPQGTRGIHLVITQRGGEMFFFFVKHAVLFTACILGASSVAFAF